MLSDLLQTRLIEARDKTAELHGIAWMQEEGAAFFIDALVADDPRHYPPGLHAEIISKRREAETFLGGLLGLM